MVIIVLGMSGVGFLMESNIVSDDDAATAERILANELSFRIGVLSEVIIFVLVVLLSVSLYIVLKTVDRHLAQLALLWRLGEAIIGGGVTVVGSLVPLLLLHREAAFEAEQLQGLVGVFLDVREAGLDVVLVFMGMGGVLFCYLFLRSRLIPRALAAWGVLAYLSMLVLGLASILWPDLPDAVRTALYVPGGLCEVVLGLWLIVKGVDDRQWDERAPGPA